jgi:hypothetical protein
MKKILLAIVLVLLIGLSACSLNQYFPNTTNETPVIVLNDTFSFTEEPVTAEQNDTTQDLESEEEQPAEEQSEEDFSGVITTITVVEGETADLSFLAAQDPDGDVIRYSYEDPFNSLGKWATEDGDEGTYLIDVTASDSILSTTETARVIVNPSNKGPVIDCPDRFSVNEGEFFEVPCTIYDNEGDEVIFAVDGYLDSLRGQAEYDAAGEYEITITADDGNRQTTKTITLMIADVNRAPVVESLDQITVVEGDFVFLNIDANDPDGDTVSISYPILFDDDGVWETARGDAGNYELEAEVSDGDAVTIVPVRVVVEKLNVAPVIENLEDIEVDEGETITLDVEASDPDGDEIFISYSGFMTSDTYTTNYDDAGEYEVLVSVTDGRFTTEETVQITVNNKNRPPVFVVS